MVRLYVIVEEGSNQEESYVDCGGICALTPLLVSVDETAESRGNAKTPPHSKFEVASHNKKEAQADASFLNEISYDSDQAAVERFARATARRRGV